MISPPITFCRWIQSWCDDRARRGLSSAAGDLGRLKKWVFPRLGRRPMAEITEDELVLLVEYLDEVVRDEEISWRSAEKLWCLVRGAFRDAKRSKNAALRVRRDNPAADVEGPDRGVERADTYLYPSEFLAVMRCERIPLLWRRVIALNVYTYARAGELLALEAEDVDVQRRVVHVHRSLKRTGDVATTKTARARRFAMERALVPLARRMLADARVSGATRLIADMPCRHNLAERLRGYLRMAGVTRADLFARDATRKPITWHDLRATGITWMAIRGDEPLRIMRRAGHRDLATTQLYVREAESVEYLRSEVFPPLPPALVASSRRKM